MMMMMILRGKLLQNITIVAASNVLGEQDVLWGFDEGQIYDLVDAIIAMIIIKSNSYSTVCHHQHLI